MQGKCLTSTLFFFCFQSNLRPQPREWYHSPKDFELKIPKSAPLTYTQLPFYLHGLCDTMEIKSLIGQVRDLSERFENRGLPNYPSGKLMRQYFKQSSSILIVFAPI